MSIESLMAPSYLKKRSRLKRISSFMNKIYWKMKENLKLPRLRSYISASSGTLACFTAMFT